MGCRRPIARILLASSALLVSCGAERATPVPEPPVAVVVGSSAPMVTTAEPSAAPVTEVAAPPIAWTDEAGAKRARAAKRPFLLFFHAAWSASSVVLDRSVWVDEMVRRAARGTICARIDVTDIGPENEDSAARFGIDHVPTVLIIAASGEEVARFEDTASPEQVAAALKRVR
jgi:thiol:disulfide interchange protein